jgi:hypothetical protein
MSDDTIGSKLLRLKEQSGLTLNNIAKAGGYSSPSSIQRYFSIDYSPQHLPRSVADRLMEALVGFGDPVVTKADIEELTETGFYLRRQPRPSINIRRSEIHYIPCHPSYAAGASLYDGIDFEIMTLSEEEEVRRFNKPSRYGLRHIHATYVSTSSMIPRFQPGEVVFYEHDRPPQLGSDVLICLSVEDQEAVYALGRLVAQTATDVAIETLSPAQTTRIDREHIQMVQPIISAAEILGEYVNAD